MFNHPLSLGSAAWIWSIASDDKREGTIRIPSHGRRDDNVVDRINQSVSRLFLYRRDIAKIQYVVLLIIIEYE